jgi:pimeloyl-ACP methyl ester carboxylesterase
VTTPILFVPGVLGTTLVDARGRRRWGSAAGLLTSWRIPVGEDGAAGLRPGEVLWSFAIVPPIVGAPVYEQLARAFEQAGVRRGSLDAPAATAGFYGLAYDWREDVVAAARAIEAGVARLVDALGVSAVTLVAHSWGCNAVRYFLRYGGADVLAPNPEPPRPGAARVAHVVALGPLLGGTWQALHEAQHGFPVAIGLGVTPAQSSTAACLYQLLPYGGDAALDHDGRETALDLAVVATWRSRELGPFQPRIRARLDEARLTARIEAALTRGARVWALLETPHPNDGAVDTVIYAVRDRPTLTRLVIDTTGRPLASLDLIRRRAPALLPSVSAPGDGYVPFTQVCRHAAGHRVVGLEGGSHRDLYRHATVLADLGRAAGATA